MELELTVYDCHEVQKPLGAELEVEPFSYWHKFKITIDLTQVSIEAFREYVLFIDKEDTGTPCTMIILNNGNVLYCVDRYSRFKDKLDKIKKEAV